MKGVVFTYIFLSCAILLAASGDYDITFKQVNLQTSEITYTLSNYNLTQISLNGQNFSKIYFQSGIATNKKGYAQLPVISQAIQLPSQKNMDVVIKEIQYQDYQLDYPLVPSKGVLYRSDNMEETDYNIDPASQVDAWYPAEIAAKTQPYIVRDVRGTNVQIHPFQYNAQKNILRVFTHITLELAENTDTPTNPLYPANSFQSSDLQSVYKSAFLNYEPQNKLAKSGTLTVQQLGDLLVITTPRDEEAIEPYIQWKREKGFTVYKEVVATGTNVADLIQQKYNENSNILYVQLVGDWEDIQGYADSSSNAPQDPRLGCVVGDDDYPDICIGRFSAKSAEEVAIQVNKVIHYERDINASDNWLSTATGVASNQGSGDDLESDSEHQDVIWQDKLNQFTYDNYNSVYDPTASKELLIQAVNNGTGLINYTGHGNLQGWSTSEFRTDDISGLNNGNKLPVIFSVACNNGLYNSENDCFAETWLKKENGGAVGMLAASIDLPWASSMRGQDYFMDVLVGGYNYDAHDNQWGINTSEQRSILGSVIFNGFILMLSEMSGYTDIETVHSWNLFGDVTLQLRTKEAEQLHLSNKMVTTNSPFETMITLNEGLQGAIVTLSQDGKYYSSTSDADGHVYIEHDLKPGKAKLVVTAFNAQTISENLYVTDQTEMPMYVMGNSSIECAQGVFYDNGGLNESYGSDENLITTIYPQDASTAIKAVFQSFDVDESDRLYIYNGTSVDASEIAGSPFYGSNIPDVITATNPSGALTFHFVSDSEENAEGWIAEITTTTVSEIENNPTTGLREFKLYANYPNPFNPTTTIPFNLAKNSHVTIEIYDMTGRCVSTIINEQMAAGYHEVKFDAQDLSSGLYLYRLQAGTYNQVKKMMVLK